MDISATVPALLLLAVSAFAALPLPDYIHPCSAKLSDKKLSQCALERARTIIPKVIKGDPKYSVPVLDPLFVDRLVVINGDGPLGMQLIASDVNIHGIPDLIVNNIVHTSGNPYVDTYAITIPEAVINAKYNISGRILLLPISGRGNVVMKFKNLKITYQFEAMFEKREDGEIYYVPQPGSRLDVEVDGMSVHLDNLFNGDKTLVENTNKFLNDEWKEVFESLKPSFTAVIAEMIKSLLQGVYTQVPSKHAFMDFEEFMSDERFVLKQ